MHPFFSIVKLTEPLMSIDSPQAGEGPPVPGMVDPPCHVTSQEETRIGP